MEGVYKHHCDHEHETETGHKDKDELYSTTLEEDEEIALIGLEILELSSEEVETTELLSKEQEEVGELLANMDECPPEDVFKELSRIRAQNGVRQLLENMEKYEYPSEAVFKEAERILGSGIQPFSLGDSEEDSMKRFQHFTEVTIYAIIGVIEFCKIMLGFDCLSREDQITLLKACSSEMVILNKARKYDRKTDSIVFAGNQHYTRESYYSSHLEELADPIFNFCRYMCSLQLDDTESALLKAMLVFSERPGLLDSEKVALIRTFYTRILREYIEVHRRPGNNLFATLTSALVELRILGNFEVKLYRLLKIKKMNVPPFLQEIWDLQ